MTSQALNGVLFASIVPLATVTVQASAQAASDGSFLITAANNNTLTFTLNGGVSNSYVITPTVTRSSGNAVLSPTNTCTVTSTTPTCKLTVNTTGDIVGDGDFSISFVVNPARQITPSTMLFHTWQGSLPDLSRVYNAVSATNSYLYFGTGIGYDTSYGLEKCSTLSNGKIYACLSYSIPRSKAVSPSSGNFTNIVFNANYVYIYSYLGSYMYNNPAAMEVVQCNVDANGNVGNCGNPISLTGAPFNNSSGVYNGNAYTNGNISATYFVSKGLWQCLLTNNQFALNQCSLVSTSGLSFNDAGSMQVHGNSVYISQTYGLVECAINPATAGITGCQKVIPSNTSSQNYLNATYSNDLIIFNNYLYLASSSSFGVNLSGLSTGSTAFTISLNHLYAMVGFNNYLYLSADSYYTQNPDGSLVSQGAAVGY